MVPGQLKNVAFHLVIIYSIKKFVRWHNNIKYQINQYDNDNEKHVKGL